MTSGVKVLIVAPAPLSDDWAGGISNFVRSFVANMPTDFTVAIAGVADRGESSIGQWRDMTVAGRDVRFMPVASLGVPGRVRTPVKARAMWGMLMARRRIATEGTVIQVHAPAMDFPLALRRAPTIRVVHNAPDNLASHDAGTLWRHSSLALRAVERVSMSRAARVYFVDHATYQRYTKDQESDRERLQFLRNGIDTNEFAVLNPLQRETARAHLAHQFGVNPAAPWVLFCGRLDRQKDPGLLVATFARARALPGLEDAQLLIVGAGPLERSTRQAARDAGVGDATQFVGTLDHDRLPEVMGASDVLLLTSAYEAAPFVVLEALACGVPVVSTDVGDVPIVVQHQSTGWIASERSADELARGLAWAIAQPRDEIAPRSATSMRAYRIQDVLLPFYDAHRRLLEPARR